LRRPQSRSKRYRSRLWSLILSTRSSTFAPAGTDCEAVVRWRPRTPILIAILRLSEGWEVVLAHMWRCSTGALKHEHLSSDESRCDPDGSVWGISNFPRCRFGVSTLFTADSSPTTVNKRFVLSSIHGHLSEGLCRRNPSGNAGKMQESRCSHPAKGVLQSGPGAVSVAPPPARVLRSCSGMWGYSSSSGQNASARSQSSSSSSSGSSMPQLSSRRMSRESPTHTSSSRSPSISPSSRATASTNPMPAW